jgi:hypothetical protein
MKLFTGWAIAAGLALAGTAGHAQMLAPYDRGGPAYAAASDFDGAYAGLPPAQRYGHGPSLLPPPEVYTVLRESGFLPLGIPRLRGNVYTIAVMDRGGDDGRLVIDARTGRILRFVPAYVLGPTFDGTPAAIYGPEEAPPPTAIRGVPRPPAPIPHVASRSVPVPKPAPARNGDAAPLAAKPAPEAAQQPQQAVNVPPKPAEAPAPAPTVGQARPAPAILPTRDMPPAQGLD